jgi:hypothetical protein
MANNTTPQINQRFINEQGLVLTIVHFSDLQKDTVGNNFYCVSFDNEQIGYYLVVNEVFTDINCTPLSIKPFILEEDKLYLTIEGYEIEFEIITDETNKNIYVSDEGNRQYSSDGKVILGEGFSSFFMIAGENNDYVKSVLQERKFKQSDFVDVKVVEQEAIPANINPFHYDLSNMCTPIANGWIVMHAGPPHKTNPSPTTYLILVNTISGQRIKLELSKRQ